MLCYVYRIMDHSLRSWWTIWIPLPLWSYIFRIYCPGWLFHLNQRHKTQTKNIRFIEFDLTPTVAHTNSAAWFEFSLLYAEIVDAFLRLARCLACVSEVLRTAGRSLIVVGIHPYLVRKPVSGFVKHGLPGHHRHLFHRLSIRYAKCYVLVVRWLVLPHSGIQLKNAWPLASVDLGGKFAQMGTQNVFHGSRNQRGGGIVGMEGCFRSVTNTIQKTYCSISLINIHFFYLCR